MSMAQRPESGSLAELSSDIASSVNRRIQKTETSLFGIRLVLILIGGALAGLAGFLPETAQGAVPWKEIFGLGGAIMALIGGAIVLWAEKGGVTDLENARKALQAAESFRNQKRDLLGRLADARDLDERRRHLISAQKVMLETAEQVFARANGMDGETAMRNLLDSCQNSLLAAMNFRAGERYNLSVFKVEEVNGTHRLVRLVNRCADRNEEQKTGRSWKSGEGFSGAAWSRGKEVILADTSTDEAKNAFYVSEGNQNEGDLSKYRSLISLPLTVGMDNSVWGVLTITSDRVRRFSSEPSSDASPSVEAARAIGKALELLASYPHLWDKVGKSGVG